MDVHIVYGSTVNWKGTTQRRLIHSSDGDRKGVVGLRQWYHVRKWQTVKYHGTLISERVTVRI